MNIFNWVEIIILLIPWIVIYWFSIQNGSSDLQFTSLTINIQIVLHLVTMMKYQIIITPMLLVWLIFLICNVVINNFMLWPIQGPSITPNIENTVQNIKWLNREALFRKLILAVLQTTGVLVLYIHFLINLSQCL